MCGPNECVDWNEYDVMDYNASEPYRSYSDGPVSGYTQELSGSHFWPYNQTSLGLNLPALHAEENHGLVLDRASLQTQVYLQEALILDINQRVNWTRRNDEWSTMNYIYRSRKDVKREQTWVAADFEHWEYGEIAELNQLKTSQCSEQICTVMFNTSSLEMIGKFMMFVCVCVCLYVCVCVNCYCKYYPIVLYYIYTHQYHYNNYINQQEQ